MRESHDSGINGSSGLRTAAVAVETNIPQRMAPRTPLAQNPAAVSNPMKNTSESGDPSFAFNFTAVPGSIKTTPALLSPMKAMNSPMPTPMPAFIDGLTDVVAGNINQRDRYYTRQWRTSPARATSLEIDAETDYITAATLTADSETPANTGIDFLLSNNGGQRWFKVRPGIEFPFPTFGSDLRWRAELHSLSPVLTPTIDSLTITAAVGLNAKTTWRTMHWTIDELQNPTLEATLWGDAANPDNDRHNNLFEYIAGTTPTDMNSDFSLAIEAVPGQSNQKNIIFSPRLPDRSYSVQSRPDLSGTSLSPLGSSTVSDNGQTRTVTDTDASGTTRFYQVEITFP